MHLWDDGRWSGTRNDFGTDQIFSNKTVNVVWTASSGGKTQTLFKYDVQ
jgi:hypothetical protein